MAKFTGEHLYRNFYFNKIGGSRFAILLNRGFRRRFFSGELCKKFQRSFLRDTHERQFRIVLFICTYIFIFWKHACSRSFRFFIKFFWELYCKYFWLLALFLYVLKFCKNIYRLNYYENDKHVRVFIVHFVVFIPFFYQISPFWNVKIMLWPGNRLWVWLS